MPDTNIGSAVPSDLSGSIAPFSVDSAVTDGADGSSDLEYMNPDWSTDYGYYKSIPQFKKAVDTMALWTIGAGFESNEPTEMLLGSIKGNGKDCFDSILENLIIGKIFSRDSFAEVIRDGDGVLVNLKPLDASSMVIVQNRKGLIKGYKKVSKGKRTLLFKPEEIFHLSHDRVSDEIKGTRIIDSLQWVIDARAEAMSDWRVVLRRNVRPMRIWFLDTDDVNEINAYKAMTDKAYGQTENIYVPKGTVETEVASVAPNATMNPLAWIDLLNDQFFQNVGVPQILFGNAKGFTDASGKIVYLAFEQTVKKLQLYIEKQVLNQLNLEIKLEFPASLQNELISSREKDSDISASQPNDQQVELEGNK